MEEVCQLGNVFAILGQDGFLGMADFGYEPEAFATWEGVIDLQGSLEGQQRVIQTMDTEDGSIGEQTCRHPWVLCRKGKARRPNSGQDSGEPARHTPRVQDVVLPRCRGTAVVGYRRHRAWSHDAVRQDTTGNFAIQRQTLHGDRTDLLPLRGHLERDIGAEGHPEDAQVLDVLRLTQKIAGAQDIAYQGLQRRLPCTLAEATVVKTEHRTASPAEEFDVVEMRRQISRRPGTKQDDRGLSLRHPCGPWLPSWLKPKPAQMLPVSVGEGDRLGAEAEIGRYLVAISIR